MIGWRRVAGEDVPFCISATRVFVFVGLDS